MGLGDQKQEHAYLIKNKILLGFFSNKICLILKYWDRFFIWWVRWQKHLWLVDCEDVRPSSNYLGHTSLLVAYGLRAGQGRYRATLLWCWASVSVVSSYEPWDSIALYGYSEYILANFCYRYRIILIDLFIFHLYMNCANLQKKVYIKESNSQKSVKIYRIKYKFYG